MKRIDRDKKRVEDSRQINRLLDIIAHDPELSHEDHKAVLDELRNEVQPVTPQRLKKIIRNALTKG